MLGRRTCSLFKPSETLGRRKGLHKTHGLTARCLSQDTLLSSHEILTLLHKTNALLPRALASTRQIDASHAMKSWEFWDEALSMAHEDLKSRAPRPARIAVHGVGEHSGAQNLVTALLEEPLTSDESQNERVRNRWRDREGTPCLTISSCATPDSRPFTVQIPSSYLLQFPMPLEITEIPSTVPATTYHNFPAYHIDDTTLRTLLEADIAIIVCNPFITPLSPILSAPQIVMNPNVFLVLTSTPPPPPLLTIDSFMSRFALDGQPQQPPIGLEGPRILIVDPMRAIEANASLAAEPRSPTAIQRYQDGFSDSRMSTVTNALQERLVSTANLSHNSLRIQTSLVKLRCAMDACHASLKEARHDVGKAWASISELRSRMEEAKVRARSEVLGQTEDFNPSLNITRAHKDIVTTALKEAKKEMKETMEHLTWWRMLWRVDDISHIVSQAMSKVWCRGLERQLILQTGQLSALQRDITASTFAILSAHSTIQFKSAVLHNRLKQLASSQSYHLTPNTLTSPIYSRSAQIVKYTTTKLHIAGQRAVLGMTGGLAGGGGISWAGWVGWLSGHEEGLLGIMGMDASTAMGAGAIIMAATLRWGVGTWERSKREWWENWARVGEGLGRDLRTTLDKSMEEQVLVIGEEGCQGLSDVVMRRKEEIEEIEGDLASLQNDLTHLERKIPTTISSGPE